MARSTYFDQGRIADACPGSESGYAQRFQCGNIVKRLIWTRMIADIVRYATSGANMVNHLHALAADAADHQTLQQRGTLTRRALATLGAEGMRIHLKLSLVFLVFVPGDVAEMGAEQQGVPLVLRYSLLLGSLQRPAYAS